MAATGELIRMINYVDDMATTLRRIKASVPFMTDEERNRLAEHIRKFQPDLEEVTLSLEKAEGR